MISLVNGIYRGWKERFCFRCRKGSTDSSAGWTGKIPFSFFQLTLCSKSGCLLSAFFTKIKTFTINGHRTGHQHFLNISHFRDCLKKNRCTKRINGSVSLNLIHRLTYSYSSCKMNQPVNIFQCFFYDIPVSHITNKKFNGGIEIFRSVFFFSVNLAVQVIKDPD